MPGLTLGALPHLSYQPIWVAILFLSMIGWRCMAIFRNWHLPTKQHPKLKWLQRFLTFLAFALLINSYGHLIGRDAGVALLTAMLGLKVTEIRTYRDYYLSCFLGYFLVVTNFFYSQSIATAGLMFIVVIIMTSCLISLNDSQHSLSNKSIVKLAGKMLLQAIPLMIVLFIFFPRISGPLWGLPVDAYAAKTGIDNKMTLGQFSHLVQSDDVAFRVKFSDKIPKQSALYWRGPVLWHTDGMTWTELNQKEKLSLQPRIISSGTHYDYTITLEAHNNSWLFALDFPSQVPTEFKSHFSHDGQLLSDEKVKQRRQYQLSSRTQFHFNPDSESNLTEALELPKNQHPRTIKLAHQWRHQTKSPQKLVHKALNYFNQQDFYYTLSPPSLKGDTIDNFLFDTRKGFCEYYAASFTILMRAAGVPTRIVTGYQGGEINPVDNFLIVRQRDAHAWAEVWIKGQGWLRVDPTAAVSKQRIEQGINTIMPLSMRTPLLISESQYLAELWQKISNNLDAIDNKWNQWILAYGPRLQKQFLTKLGMASPNWLAMVVWLTISLSMILLLISVLLFYQKKRQDPVVRLYQRFCNKAKRKGLIRANHEGPLDFALRLKQHYPNKSNDIDNITQLYINLRYGDQSVSISTLRQAIKLFSTS